MELLLGIFSLILIVVNIFFTYIMNKKNIFANVVSISRIKWIDDTRKLMADYLTLSYSYAQEYSDYIIHDKYSKKYLNKKLKSIQNIHYLLLLHFAENEDNKNMEDSIVEVVKWLNNFSINFSEGSETINYDDKPITDLLKTSRKYFNNEWKKAKKGQ